jgi:hypothetical protein
MPLVSSTLAQGLLDLTRNFPQTPQEAGRRWASVYAQYASTAKTAVGGSIISLAAQERVLGPLLGAVFATSQLAPQTASNLASAFTSFWLLPPVPFVGSFPGIVTAVAGTAALQAGLLSVWAANFASRAPNEQAMQKIAGVIDVFTRTVIVTTATVPSPTVGPLI